MEMPNYLRKNRVPHKVKKIQVERVIPKKKFVFSPTHMLAKQIALEISGRAPYEKKAIDLMKTDEMKKAKKFLKIRLGSWARAEKKFDDLLKHAR